MIYLNTHTNMYAYNSVDSFSDFQSLRLFSYCDVGDDVKFAESKIEVVIVLGKTNSEERIIHSFIHLLMCIYLRIMNDKIYLYINFFFYCLYLLC